MSKKETKKETPENNKIEIERSELKNEKEKLEELINESDENNKSNDSNENEKSDSDDLNERIQQLEETNKELNDRLLRRIAEFENYKRRTENDQMNLLKYAAEPFIAKILPVYDDLNRSLSHAEDEKNNKSLLEGLKLVLDKFNKILKEQGVEKIETKGKEFDFNLHDALLQQPSSDVPENTIIEEIEPGYMYKDKVLRHAKVIVSLGAENKDEDTGESKSE